MVGSETPPPQEGRIVTEDLGRVFAIGIDRPHKFNAFTKKMIGELADAFTKYERNDQYWCALLFAKGEHFTSGLELDAFSIAEQFIPPDLVDPFGLREPVRKKPLVAAVHGICFTIGVELMLSADIVVAASGCRFAQLEVKRGLMAFGGATLRMVERAGFGNAMRYLLTGDEFDEREALRLGFVQEVVENSNSFSRALALAETVAKQAPLAVRATRESSLLYLDQGREAAISSFDIQLERIAQTEDFKEGVRSFLERRDGRFKGI